MSDHQKGFIPIGIAIAIVATALITAGAGYGVYKYNETRQDDYLIGEELEKDSETIEESGQSSTSTNEDPDSEEILKTQTQIEPVISTEAPTYTASTVNKPVDFEATCEVQEKYVDEGDTIFARINTDLDGEEYIGEWNKTYLRNGSLDGAYFEITSPNAERGIWATITRLADGYSKVVTCPLNIITDELASTDDDLCQVAKEEAVSIAKQKEEALAEHIANREEIESAGGMSKSGMIILLSEEDKRYNEFEKTLNAKLSTANYEVQLYCD